MDNLHIFQQEEGQESGSLIPVERLVEFAKMYDDKKVGEFITSMLYSILGEDITHTDIRLVREIIEYYYPKMRRPESKKKLLSDLELQNIINSMLTRINSNRHWFVIGKVLMLHGQIPVDDFHSFCNKLEELYPAGVLHKPDPKDLARLNVASWRGPVQEWDSTDAPIKRTVEYRQYETLAKDFEELVIQKLGIL